MKLTTLVRTTLQTFALFATFSIAHAQLSYNTVTGTNLYTDSSGDSIVGFDWDSSNNLYYATATSGFNFSGLYQANLSNPALSTTLVAGNSHFSGAGLAAIGNYVYFNDGNGIYNYSISGTTSTSISTASTYSVFGHSGQLYTTGSPTSISSNNNQISVGNLSGTGSLTAGLIGIEQDIAFSGPMAFDSSGNLFYAAGSTSDFSNFPHTAGNGSTIFEWTAAQVAAALLNPSTSPLLANNASLWLDYQNVSNYGSYAGATGLVIENNQLLLTLTNFEGPSALVSFGIGSGTAYNGTATTLVTDGGATGTSLGTLAVNNGNLYVSDGGQILQIQSVPEPSSLCLVALGIAGVVLFRGLRARRLAPAAMLTTTVFFLR